MALSVSEQTDEGPRLRVVGHAGPALLLRSMDLDRRSEKATGLVCDNLFLSYIRVPLAKPCVEPGNAEEGGDEQSHLLDTGVPTALLWPCGAFPNG